MQLGYTGAIEGVSVPCFIGVILLLELDTHFADRADYHNYAVIITGQATFVVIWAGMLCAEDILASVAFEGQEVLLVAMLHVAVLTNVSEFHVLLF